MKLSDILPIEKWVELEKEIHRRSGLNASVFDANGNRTTDFQKWANRLCPVIKSNENGQSFICAAAHLNISAQAKTTKRPVIQECDAGLVKIAVPIFVGEEFLGVAGGCGLKQRGSEVESVLINKTTGIGVREIDSLSNDIGIISDVRINSVIKYIEKQVDWIKHDFEKRYFISVETN